MKHEQVTKGMIVSAPYYGYRVETEVVIEPYLNGERWFTVVRRQDHTEQWIAHTDGLGPSTFHQLGTVYE